jgi:protoporphyrinogen oxidase
MNRRNFIKTSSLVTLPILLQSCQWDWAATSYPIEVSSDASTGPLLRKSGSFETISVANREALIVGGGIAGMSAAYSIKDKDFLLCELSNNLGGSSSKAQFDGISFSQGAHYDLAYPDYYGEEVLQLFEDLNIITHLPWRDAWGFVDQQHIITHRRKNHCFVDGNHRKEVLDEGKLKDDFIKLISPYLGKMNLPTRLIQNDLHHLNNIDFISFLNKNISLTPEFVRGLDYHMKDDYGSDAAKVSALAGIHYFMCRPYYNEIVELFSPPEGNSYFINKMAEQLNNEQVLTEHLVKSIKEEKSGFKVEIIDVQNQQIKSLNVKKVIYAGQKHALKYIYPEGHQHFKDNTYSPWMVVNIITDDKLPTPGYWQNEMLTEDSTLLGFVDSNTQHNADSKHRVLSAYYCLPPESRNDLINAEANKSQIAEMTVNHLSKYFDQDISSSVLKVHIKVMGHTMAIPSPGFLFNDKNQYRVNKNLAYAGADNGRLPLLYEAVDSGIVAVKLLSL